jgi:hypothetical protein
LVYFLDRDAAPRLIKTLILESKTSQTIQLKATNDMALTIGRSARITAAAARLLLAVGARSFVRALLRGFNNLFERCGELIIDLVSEVTVRQIAARVVGRNDRVRTQIRNVVLLQHRPKGLE